MSNNNLSPDTSIYPTIEVLDTCKLTLSMLTDAGNNIQNGYRTEDDWTHFNFMLRNAKSFLALFPERKHK